MRIILLSLALIMFSVSSQATEVSKDEWVSSMETVLPAAFCNKQMYFRQCFSISAVECEESASSATRICLKKHMSDIPAILKQPGDGSKWGSKVGECAGIAYETSLIKKRLNSDKCNDINNWN